MDLTRRRFVMFQLFFMGGLFSEKLRSHLLFFLNPERDGELLDKYLSTLAPKRNPKVVWSSTEGGLRLSCPALPGENSLSTNEVGRVIWERCDGETNIQEIVQEIMTRFEVDKKTCIMDTFDHLRHLKKCGMITMVYGKGV